MLNYKAYILTLLMCFGLSSSLLAQMNNPYVDDKRVHFGFFLGMNFMSYGITDSKEVIDGEIYHARVTNLTPGLEFSSRTINYKTESGNPVKSMTGGGNTVDILAIPISLPLYIKFSADREKNYRPYVIAGGGVSYNFSRDKEKPVLMKGWDYFVSVGLGVDLYLRWFKLCPEIKYQIGFNNMLTPVSQRPELPMHEHFYTNALTRLSSRMITISFNFE